MVTLDCTTTLPQCVDHGREIEEEEEAGEEEEVYLP